MRKQFVCIGYWKMIAKRNVCKILKERGDILRSFKEILAGDMLLDEVNIVRYSYSVVTQLNLWFSLL